MGEEFFEGLELAISELDMDEEECDKRAKLMERYYKIKEAKAKSSNASGDLVMERAREQLLYRLLSNECIPDFRASRAYNVFDVVKIRSSDGVHEHYYCVVTKVEGSKVTVTYWDYNSKLVNKEYVVAVPENLQEIRKTLRIKPWWPKSIYKAQQSKTPP